MLLDEEELEATDGPFYRPSGKKIDRPLPGDFPFREKKFGDAEEEDDEPFLRSQRRVAVRRGLFPRSRWGRIGVSAAGLAAIALLAGTIVAVHSFAAHDPRFRIDSSDNIQILGNSEVTQPELLSVFGGDMGRNVFFVPLTERRAELERLPWVQSATVMRLLPDQLRVAVVERTPVAFVMNGNQVGLVDAAGVLLPMNAKTLAAKHYSFPVVTGIEAADPQSTRAARMKVFRRFLADLDSGGEKLSAQLSEVDLSDPEDVRATVPSSGGDLLLHFGEEDFLNRWQIYQSHLAEWKQQYPRLASVDLRYERQVVLGMEKGASIAPANKATTERSDPGQSDPGRSDTERADIEHSGSGATSPGPQKHLSASRKPSSGKSAIKKPAPPAHISRSGN